jgi:hypothetical protein
LIEGGEGATWPLAVESLDLLGRGEADRAIPLGGICIIGSGFIK